MRELYEKIKKGTDRRASLIALKKELKDEAKKKVFLTMTGNRLDEIIMFKPLTKENIGGIVDLLVADLNRRLKDQELSLRLTDTAKDYIIEGGYDPVP